jgi:putative membrane protein
MPQLLVVLAISSAVTWTRGRAFGHLVPLTITPFTLLGVSLAIFLGFRNSASYDRFWEGRKLWGTLLNVSRSLVRQSLSLTPLEAKDARILEWIDLLAAFTHALRHQLRQSQPANDLQRLLPAERQTQLAMARYRPAVILTYLGQWVRARKTEGLYGEITAAAFDQNLGILSDVLGGCERLANTLLPYPYAIMIHRTVYLYCFLLPFGLVGSIGIMTPLISVLVAYTFMALECLAAEIEEPFGTSENDLALESMSLVIENSMREMVGQPMPAVSPTKPEWFAL